MNDCDEKKHGINPWKPLMFLWIGFSFFHILLMFIDWNLRDHSSNSQPMPGGIPQQADAIIIWTSIATLGIAVIYWQPRTWGLWVRILLGIAQVAFAWALMIIGRLYYVLTYGIDTL